VEVPQEDLEDQHQALVEVPQGELEVHQEVLEEPLEVEEAEALDRHAEQ